MVHPIRLYLTHCISTLQCTLLMQHAFSVHEPQLMQGSFSEDMQAKALPDVFNSTGRVVTQRQKQPTDTAESTHSTRCGIRSTQVRRANCETTLYPEGEQVLNRRAAVSTAALLALSCRCHAPAHAALIDEAVAERVFNSAGERSCRCSRHYITLQRGLYYAFYRSLQHWRA